MVRIFDVQTIISVYTNEALQLAFFEINLFRCVLFIVFGFGLSDWLHARSSNPYRKP